ncbi:(d)CMP kinase [Paraliomyxa miuraensis]|uniref:(d)CMP kinase n=1 Tax=Paraliomyxa miuraensis TaxID=376150 RepID=UPI00225A4BC5|nr:(d)CMP kinase [Paraliomyxa miuraensis]MCX4245796.1 (d)CMP kinase [Paraliomyxa miuraensis]
MSAPSHADQPLLIVIDGPAGAGKTTIARRLARHLGLPLLDTGAIYRSLALTARRRGVAWDDEAGLVALADALPIRFGGLGSLAEPDAPHDVPQRDVPQRVWLGDDDVTEAIRTPEISEGASRVSALPGVRKALLGLQRALGARGCVAEGRDMGTVVFPHAPHKFFVTADLQARAARRQADLVPSEPGAMGQGPSLSAVQAELHLRDARDSGRAAAPLVRAEDAVLIDTTSLSPEGVLDLMLEALGLGYGRGDRG